MQSAVVVLSGPWLAYRRDGTFTGVRTDINTVRFAHGAKLAIREGRILVVSVKETELDRYRDMVSETLVQMGAKHYPVVYEIGACHTLANVWHVLRFACKHEVDHLTVATSCWHLTRVQYLFQRMATIVAGSGASVPSIWYRPAPFSRVPAVRSFERRVLRDCQEPRKLGIECARLVEYGEALRTIELPTGTFPPEPDGVTGFIPHPKSGVILNSVQEPGQRASPPQPN